MKNLELVQVHSLFTFMGNDRWPGWLSTAEQTYDVMMNKFACVGVFTSSAPQ